MGEPPDFELMANRYHRLIKEILLGEVRRTTFQPWEIDLLVDLQECRLTRSRRDDALRRYQKVAHKQMEHGRIPPLRLREFLSQRDRKPALLPPPDSAPRDHSSPYEA